MLRLHADRGPYVVGKRQFAERKSESVYKLCGTECILLYWSPFHEHVYIPWSSGKVDY